MRPAAVCAGANHTRADGSRNCALLPAAAVAAGSAAAAADKFFLGRGSSSSLTAAGGGGPNTDRTRSLLRLGAPLTGYAGCVMPSARMPSARTQPSSSAPPALFSEPLAYSCSRDYP